MENGTLYLESVHRQFIGYKKMVEQAIEQLNDDQLRWQPDENSLAITTIMKHMSRNFLSRWTDFLTTDGEKEWRRENREDEFVDTFKNKEELMALWEDAWSCLSKTISSLNSADLTKTIYIRNEGVPAMEAINRGFTHAAYHVGQIVYLAKLLKSDQWKSLSIPKGESNAYNEKMFSQKKAIKKLS